RELYVDVRVGLREARHLAFAIEPHRQLVDPLGENALDVVLPQGEDVVVSRRKIADVQRNTKVDGGIRAALREEPIGDSSLIEYLDRARMHTARARPQQLLLGAALDNRDIDIRERQLGRQ